MTALEVITYISRGILPECPPEQVDACFRLGLLDEEDGRVVLTDEGWRILENAP